MLEWLATVWFRIFRLPISHLKTKSQNIHNFNSIVFCMGVNQEGPREPGGTDTEWDTSAFGL
jgi:hypothetical protein